VVLGAISLLGCGPSDPDLEVNAAASRGTVVVDAVGPGCPDGSCIWLSGSGFKRGCQLNFYDANWVNGANPIAVQRRADCSANLVTAKIPEHVRAKFLSVHVLVYNPRSVTWSAPVHFALTPALHSYKVGVGEPLVPLNSCAPTDTACLDQRRARLATDIDQVLALRPQTFRMWFISRYLWRDDGTRDEIYYQDFNTVVRRMREAGVELVGSDQMWTDMANWGQPFIPCGEPHYHNYLSQNRQFWHRLAATFPEVKIWETGNELNSGFMHPGQGCSGPFSLAQRMSIITDLMFSATQGVRSARTGAITLTPAFAPFGGMIPAGMKASDFLTTQAEIPGTNGGAWTVKAVADQLAIIYEWIASGQKGSRNPRDFFDGIAYHPYLEPGRDDPSTNNDLVTGHAAVMSVVKQYDDGKRPIWYTEYGFEVDTTRPPAEVQAREAQLLSFMIGGLNQMRGLENLRGVHVYRAFTSFDPSRVFGLYDDASRTRRPIGDGFCAMSFCNEYHGPARVGSAYFYINPSSGAYCAYPAGVNVAAASGLYAELFIPRWDALPPFYAHHGYCW
jgi:hypothetical protein